MNKIPEGPIHASVASYRGVKTLHYSFSRRLGGLRSLPGRFEVEECVTTETLVLKGKCVTDWPRSLQEFGHTYHDVLKRDAV
jgi:hypothetical protein